MTCSDRLAPLPALLFSNLWEGEVPDLEGDLQYSRRRLWNDADGNNVTSRPWVGDDFGGVVLTDQQRVSLRFSAPCKVFPCTFKLTHFSLILEALPAYFLAPNASASVSFLFQLGRYYTNTPPSSSRRLTAASPAPNYAPYVDFQTSVWTKTFTVTAGGPTLFDLALDGLQYTLWNASGAVTPGDIKLVITPFVHYNRDGISDSLRSCTPEQIRWLLSRPPASTAPISRWGFSEALGFDMLPGCPNTCNSAVIILPSASPSPAASCTSTLAASPSATESPTGSSSATASESGTSSETGTASESGTASSSASASETSSASSSVSALPTPSASESPAGITRRRQLTNVGESWFPHGCVSSDAWSCVGFFPSVQLRGELPCGVIYDEIGPIVIENRSPSSSSTPAPSTSSAAAASVDATPSPSSAAPARRRQLTVASPSPSPTYYAADCPAAVNSQAYPFITGDATAFGRFLSSDSNAIVTRTVFNSTGSFEMLVVLPAPCTRCNLHLSELWLPLASDCASDMIITAEVGFWDAAHTVFTPAPGCNGASTRVWLSAALQTVAINLGDGFNAALVAVPFVPGETQYIGLRLRASACFKLGAGLGVEDQLLCNDSVRTTPVRLLMRGDEGAWADTQLVPGLFMPTLSMEPWMPICVPWPSPSSIPSMTRTATASATPSVNSFVEQSPSASPIFVGSSAVDNSGSVAGLSTGGLAGVVIACVVGAVALAALAVFAVSRHRAGAKAPAAAAGAAPAAAAAAGSPVASAPAAVAAAAAGPARPAAVGTGAAAGATSPGAARRAGIASP
jgi:hypothetical protein